MFGPKQEPFRTGRKKGVPNKLSASAREAIECAFHKIGGIDALARWARANPGEFYKLYARLIPIDVSYKAQVTFSGLQVVYESMAQNEKLPAPAEDQTLRH